ncbi:hypothetical protein M8C21_003311, partial [Ambrosia artemisiifolia]
VPKLDNRSAAADPRSRKQTKTGTELCDAFPRTLELSPASRLGRLLSSDFLPDLFWCFPSSFSLAFHLLLREGERFLGGVWVSVFSLIMEFVVVRLWRY